MLNTIYCKINEFDFCEKILDIEIKNQVLTHTLKYL